MKLPREEAAGEVAHDARLEVCGLDARIGQGRARRFENDVTERLPFLAEVPFEVGAPGAQDINRLGHRLNVVRT